MEKDIKFNLFRKLTIIDLQPDQLYCHDILQGRGNLKWNKSFDFEQINLLNMDFRINS